MASKKIPKISTPILIVQGFADPRVDPDVAGRLRHSAALKTKITAVKISGADHRFHHHRQDFVNIMQAGAFACYTGRDYSPYSSMVSQVKRH